MFEQRSRACHSARGQIPYWCLSKKQTETQGECRARHANNRGKSAPDSVLVLTFRDTLSGAQIELVQVNVPDYKVRIPNPDGTIDTGPLSSIVNTHWHTLYWDGLRRLLDHS